MTMPAQFNTSGWLTLPDFVDPDTIKRLKQRAGQIVQAFDLDTHQHVFSTTNSESDRDNFFLTSGDKIRCFLEAGALDEHGQLTCPRAHAFNKIGHALHDLDPVFDEFSHQSRLRELTHSLGIREPQIWQSMYIFKPPRIGGEVKWHQDATYFYTDPITVTTFWFALDDATVENGCLWVAKSGADTPLRERFVLQSGRTKTLQCDPTPWPDEADAIPLEVTAGTLICFKGTLPHYSAPNLSAKPRHAYTLHITDGTASYASNNWLQRGNELPVRGF